MLAGAAAACSPSANSTGAPGASAGTAGSGAAGSGAAGSGAAGSGADAQAVDRVIRATSLADRASIQALDGIRFATAAAPAAAAVLATHPAGDVLWAATWVYASSGTDPAVLAPLLADADASIRVMAAAALVGLGDRAGLPVISASLAETDPVRGSDPPVAIGDFAAYLLGRYVVAPDAPPLPATADDAAAYPGDWATWLADHQGALRFDQGSHTWNTP
jgi:hypothetical protein